MKMDPIKVSISYHGFSGKVEVDGRKLPAVAADIQLRAGDVARASVSILVDDLEITEAEAEITVLTHAGKRYRLVEILEDA